MLAKPTADDLADRTPTLELNAEQIKMLYAAMPTSVAANIIASSFYNRLMQVLANLISNAEKFSHLGGTVDIGLSRHKDNLQISVTDYGMGIPENYQPMVFEKFTQADSSDSRSKGGTGLGLAISKMIIENLNGEIHFTST